MPFLQTPFQDLLLFEPRIWRDDRGYFYESYNLQAFRDAGIERPFVQDNQAYSTRGILRGLHFQTGEYAQAKLVRVLLGEVLDVVVDLRPNQPTYKQWYAVRLSAENHLQLYVPRGFAHGYLVLSEEALFVYKCDNFYAPGHESGIHALDPALGIDWGMPHTDIRLSEKDQALLGVMSCEL
jgi:dTDP-4-dehydrorhamnose 3,5-epimerase